MTTGSHAAPKPPHYPPLRASGRAGNQETWEEDRNLSQSPEHRTGQTVLETSTDVHFGRKLAAKDSLVVEGDFKLGLIWVPQ